MYFSHVFEYFFFSLSAPGSPDHEQAGQPSGQRSAGGQGQGSAALRAISGHQGLRSR